MKLKQDGDLGLIKGIYAMCPFIAGEWPQPQYPSSTENEGIVISVHNNRSAMAYGIDAFNARNPLAWPAFAQREDVQGLPPVVISVNECDPLRDEGIAFYRLLLGAGVSARCRQLMGMCWPRRKSLLVSSFGRRPLTPPPATSPTSRSARFAGQLGSHRRTRCCFPISRPSPQRSAV